MSLLDTLDPGFKPAAQSLYDLAERAGVHPRITSARRSYAKQAALYKAYTEGRSRYPAAPAGTSAHEYGLAFDMVVDNATDQNDLGTVWTQAGWVYGGEEDPIHYAAPKSWYQNQTPTESGPQLPAAFGTPGTVAEQAADLLLSILPTPLRGIVGTAGLANAIYSLAGGSSNLILYWLSHPVEFVRDVYAEWWTLLKLLYGV